MNAAEYRPPMDTVEFAGQVEPDPFKEDERPTDRITLTDVPSDDRITLPRLAATMAVLDLRALHALNAEGSIELDDLISTVVDEAHDLRRQDRFRKDNALLATVNLMSVASDFGEYWEAMGELIEHGRRLGFEVLTHG